MGIGIWHAVSNKLESRFFIIKDHNLPSNLLFAFNLFSRETTTRNPIYFIVLFLLWVWFVYHCVLILEVTKVLVKYISS